jgi:putative protease
MKRIEILAPAGNRESLVGAINAKADAIYLAGRKFGARAYANNFEDPDLFETINYAHLRGVLVYVTVNTLIFDEEIEELIAYTDQLVEHGVDALIIQDLGVIDILTKRYPDTDIHASTQMNTLNVHQALFLKNLGVKRIVAARETPIEIIKQIKKQVDIEVEVFVHGALCVSYSGNCLMSSMLSARSGNRGECAQPCRLAYSLLKEDELVSEESYLLSMKDLMTIEYLDQLIEAGVDSLKIEGRMRKPEYVIQTVLSYRQAILAYYEHQEINYSTEIVKLKKVFNREFTKGYLFNEQKNIIVHDFRPNHMGVALGEVIDYKAHKAMIKLTDSLEINDGYRIVGNRDYGDTVSRIIKGEAIVKKAFLGDIIKLDIKDKVEVESKVIKTSDHQLELSLAKFLDENYKSIPLTAHVIAKANQHLTLSISDKVNSVTVASQEVLEAAISRPVQKSQIIEQISKLGNTPFYFETLTIDTDEDAFIAIKDLNVLRREALAKIMILRTVIGNKKIIKEKIIFANEMDYEPKLTVKVTTLNQLRTVLSAGVDLIYYEDTIKDIIPTETLIPSKKRIQMQPEKWLTSELVSEIGSIQTHDFKHKLYTDEFMNVTNIHTVRFLSSKNISKVTLSPELSKDRVYNLMRNYQKTYNKIPGLELVVYGAVDLMITKYCPIAKTFKTKPDCHLCEINQYYLKDRFGLKFPLIHDGNCNLRILNHKPLNLMEYAKEIIDLGISLRLHFTTETDLEVIEIIKAFKAAIKGELEPVSYKKYTLGRFVSKP